MSQAPDSRIRFQGADGGGVPSEGGAGEGVYLVDGEVHNTSLRGAASDRLPYGRGSKVRQVKCCS